MKWLIFYFVIFIAWAIWLIKQPVLNDTILGYGLFAYGLLIVLMGTSKDRLLLKSPKRLFSGDGLFQNLVPISRFPHWFTGSVGYILCASISYVYFKAVINQIPLSTVSFPIIPLIAMVSLLGIFYLIVYFGLYRKRIRFAPKES